MDAWMNRHLHAYGRNRVLRLICCTGMERVTRKQQKRDPQWRYRPEPVKRARDPGGDSGYTLPCGGCVLASRARAGPVHSPDLDQLRVRGEFSVISRAPAW